jgi:hypothetical protein
MELTTSGNLVSRKKLRRAQVLAFPASRPRSLVAMEACASSHYWAREIGKAVSAEDAYRLEGRSRSRAHLAPAGGRHQFPVFDLHKQRQNFRGYRRRNDRVVLFRKKPTQDEMRLSFVLYNPFLSRIINKQFLH